LIALLAASSAQPLPAADVKDGFEYSSLEALRAKWTISNSGFAKPVEIELTNKNAKEGKKAPQLSFPPTAPVSNGRIDFSITPDIPLKQVKQVRFWLYIDNPQSIAQTGIYFAHPDLNSSFVRFGYVGLAKGWQRVSVSTDSLTVQEGSPTWDKATKMQLTFWFNGGSPATKIMLDGVVWSTTAERDKNLNGKWYE